MTATVATSDMNNSSSLSKLSNNNNNTPPQSPHLEHRLKMSAQSLQTRLHTSLDQILEDIEEDSTSLIDNIQTPPQSAASSVASVQLHQTPIDRAKLLKKLKRYTRLNEQFKQNQFSLRLQFKKSFDRLHSIQTGYIRSKASILQTPVSLTKASKVEEREQLDMPTRVEADETIVDFYHSYSKKSKQEEKAVFDDFSIDFGDEDLLNKIVNERLDCLFGKEKQQQQLLPNLSSDELMFLCEGLSADEDDEENLSISSRSSCAHTPDSRLNSLNSSNLNRPCLKSNPRKRTFNYRDANNSENINPIGERVNKKRTSSSSSTTSQYDINNICIPNEMISSNKIALPKVQNVPTPKWRELSLEPLFDPMNQDTLEELDDSSFAIRHETNEKPINSAETEEPKAQCSYWPQRTFPLSDQEYEEMLKQ